MMRRGYGGREARAAARQRAAVKGCQQRQLPLLLRCRCLPLELITVQIDDWAGDGLTDRYGWIELT